MNDLFLHLDKGFIVLGAGGHAKVLIDILLLHNKQIAGIINPSPPEAPFFQSFPYLGNDEVLNTLKVGEYCFVNGLGCSVDTTLRTSLFQIYRQQQAFFPKIIHPQAVISNSAIIGDGSQILAGAIVGPDAQINENVIINSRAIVEHDCHIKSHSHIASGAILCGDVKIEKNVHVGAGATLNPGITIGTFSTIASGSVMTSDAKCNSLYAGVPAEFKKNNNIRPIVADNHL